MSKHVHAELMAQYAEDAMETDKPWERWEVKVYYIAGGTMRWRTLERSESVFFPDNEYRRKPKSSRERFEEWWMSTTPSEWGRSQKEGLWELWQESEKQALEAANTSDKHRETCGEVIKRGVSDG